MSIRNGLVGHWRPSRGATGNTLIDSVRGNHGTLVNGPTWQASGTALAINLDGSDDYIDLGAARACQFANNFSVSFWSRTTTSTAGLTWLGHGVYGQGWYIVGNTFKSFIWYSNTTPITVTVPNLWDGGWHHLALVNSAGQGSVYFDGTLAASGTVGNVTYSNPQFAVGRYMTGGSHQALTFDDLAVFGRPITQSESVTLYTAGRGALDQRVNVPVVRGATVGGGSFTLTADGATFTESGQTAVLTVARSIIAAQGTITETGQAATLRASRQLTAAQAAINETGQDATLRAARILPISHGVFTVTGQNATLTEANATTLVASQGSFALSSQSATFTKTHRVAGDVASYSLSGVAAGLSYGGQASVVLTIDFVSASSTSGDLSVTQTTADLLATQATGELSVSELGIS